METINKTKIATKWALIYVVTSIVLTYLFELLKIDQNSGIKYVSLIPFIAFLCLGQLEFKNKNEGFMSYGEGFSVGFRYALFGGIILSLFTYIYLAFLSPQILAQSIEMQRDQMADNGMSEEQIEKSVDIGLKYGALIGAVAAAISSAIMGAIVALITAAIFKKEKPMFANVPDNEE